MLHSAVLFVYMFTSERTTPTACQHVTVRMSPAHFHSAVKKGKGFSYQHCLCCICTARQLVLMQQESAYNMTLLRQITSEILPGCLLFD